MDRNEAFDLIEPYVFGTLDEHETAAVEAHLSEGDSEFITRYREVAELSARLAMALPQYDPPEHIKEKILDRIQPPSTNREPRRQRVAMPWFGWVGWATTAVAATVAGILLGQNMMLERGVNGLKEELTTTRSRADEFMSRMTAIETELTALRDGGLILGQPEVVVIDLTASGPDADAIGKAILNHATDSGVVYFYNLDPAPDGHAYELWGHHGENNASLGTFQVGEGGQGILKIASMPDPTAVRAFTLTLEPVDGTVQPEGMTYVSGDNAFFRPVSLQR